MGGVKNGEAQASPNEILQYAVENGMIDLPSVEAALIMAENKKYLEKHPYQIYQGKDGRWYTRFKTEDGRRQISRLTRADLENAIIQHYKDMEMNPTFSELFQDWNAHRLELNKISLATFSRNQQIYKRFFTNDFGKRKIRHLEPYEIQDFLEEQIAKYNLSSKSFSNLKTIVRGVLKRAKKLKIISYNVEELFQDMDISDHVFKKRIVDDEKEIFYDEEMFAVINYCKEHSNEDQCCLGVALLFITGMRVGECVVLKHEDINIEDHTISVHRTETRSVIDGKYYYDVKDYPKTPAGVRKIVVPDNSLWLIERLKNNNIDKEFVFTNQRGRLHTQAIRKRLAQICKKLSIPIRSPHKARKTYGSILLDNHLDTNFILQQMGHTEISTTEQHYHRNRKRIEEKQKIINSVVQFSARG